MRIIGFLLFIYVFFTSNSFSQMTVNDLNVIQSILKENNDTVKYIYTEESVGQQRIKESIKRINFDFLGRNQHKDSVSALVLTNEEYKYILDENEKTKSFRFPENMISGARRISIDSVVSILRKRQKEHTKQQQKLRMENPSLANVPYDFNPVDNYVHGFSKPIFLRDNSICIIYHIMKCPGDCGEDYVLVYKKINNKWTRFLIVAHGVY